MTILGVEQIELQPAEHSEHPHLVGSLGRSGSVHNNHTNHRWREVSPSSLQAFFGNSQRDHLHVRLEVTTQSR